MPSAPPPQHPYDPPARPSRKTPQKLLIALGVGGLALVLVMAYASSESSSSSSASGISNNSSESSTTVLGCSVEPHDEMWQSCTEYQIARLPWCGADLFDISPLRTDSSAGGNSTWFSRYRVGSGTVDFLWFNGADSSRDSLKIVCGNQQRVLTGNDYRTLGQAGDELPASLR